MKAVIEGLLFVSGEEGLTMEEIHSITKQSTEEISKNLEELAKDYSKEDRGITLQYFGNHYKLTTKIEHKNFYQQMVKEEIDSTLTDAALETLAIIAYNEPITRVDIDNIRGISSTYTIRKLALKGLITIVGKSEAAGRPNLYGVTNKFLDYFGLGSIHDLPKIEIDSTNEANEETDLFSSKYKEQV